MHFTVVEGTRQLLLNGTPISDVIGLVALIVALFSVIMATRSAKESARANSLAYLPVVTLDFDHSSDKVIVKNLGKGTAVNVQVDKYYNWSADKQFKIYGLTTLAFEKVNMLNAGEQVTLKDKISGIGDPLGLTRFIIFSEHTKSLDFLVKFSDFTGKRYLTVVNIQKGEVKVKKFPRAFGLRSLTTLLRYKITQACLSVIYYLLVKYKKFNDSRNK